ncbi:hypothetical protein BU17DRAFT_86701 [Hysterangium stoloniferum]|nr:hypothetical protein BU17DRAFT_86701 [Hysterangium stoloniferum]
MGRPGPMVNRYARINEAAAGGQILCRNKDVIKEITQHVIHRDPNAQLDIENMEKIEALELKGIRTKYIEEKRMKCIQDRKPLSLQFPQELDGRLELEEAQVDPPVELGTLTVKLRSQRYPGRLIFRMGQSRHAAMVGDSLV